MKQRVARTTGIPTSKAGLERKIGNAILKALFGKNEIHFVQPNKNQRNCFLTP